MSTIFESSEFESSPDTHTAPVPHGPSGFTGISVVIHPCHGPVVPGAEALLIVVPSSHHEYFDICLTHKLWECNLETNCKHGLPLGTKQLGERPG